MRRVPSNRWWVEHDDAVRSRWNYSPVPVLEKFVVTFYIMDDILKTREVCVMGPESRIKPGRNQFARLISEVDGLCPLCQEELIVSRNGSTTNLSQAAHIYPHSPTTSEKELLKNVPRLSNDPESIENLIMLCPNCHHKFDNPRTVADYMTLFNLKKKLTDWNMAREYYKKHSLEDDLVSLLADIETVDVEINPRKLSYKVMTVRDKMNKGASNSTIQRVIRDVRDYYWPIRMALIQLEHDVPGKSDLIAKQVNLFYSELSRTNFSQDEIYQVICDWFNRKTRQQYTLLTPIITAYYIQNCEVFST